MYAFNSLFVGNRSSVRGAGMLAAGQDTYIANCTFVGNFAEEAPAGLYADSSYYPVTVTNCIFRANRALDDEGWLSQMYAGYNVNAVWIDYNCVQGWDGYYTGAGNFDADPLFVDEGHWEDPGTPDDLSDDLWIEGDYHLRADSPCINAGDPDPPLVPIYDLDHHTRVLCNRVDMGAYEFGIGDFDCYRTVELGDFAAWEACMTGPNPEPPEPPYPDGCEAYDFNADDTIDLSDFAGFQTTLPASEP